VFDHCDLAPAAHHPEFLAPTVTAALPSVPSAQVFEIDPDLADTAALCAAYNLPLENSANCVIILGRRADTEKAVACLALATTKVDVNNLVRRRLDVRKCSFAPMDWAVSTTGMEYGAITPVGLPEGMPLWIDPRVLAAGQVCIGAGRRTSKLVLDASELLRLPGAEAVEGLASPA